MSNEWVKKQYLLAWIFNVGRGLCAFVRTPAKDGIMIDCGGSKDNEIISTLTKYILPLCQEHRWKNGTRTKVPQLIVSHPHVDHFRSIEEAMALKPLLLTCPHDKEEGPEEKINWDLIENPDGTEELIEIYQSSYQKRNLPLRVFQPSNKIPHFSYGIFYIRPSECEPIETHFVNDEQDGLPKKDYGNNISIMVYFCFNDNSILFPGDMMSSGMKRALEVGCENRLVGEGIAAQFAERSASAETLRKWVNSGCSVLVAPHHGLESAYSPEFFASLPIMDPRVGLVVISEKANPRESDGSVHNKYQTRDANKVKGMTVIRDNGTKDQKFSVTTRTNGHCLVGFRGTDEVSVVVSNDLDWILTKGPERLFT